MKFKKNSKKLMITGIFFIFLIFSINLVNSGQPITSGWAGTNFVNEEEKYVCLTEIFPNSIIGVWAIINEDKQTFELVTDEAENCRILNEDGEYETCCPAEELCLQNSLGKYVCTPALNFCRDYEDQYSCETIPTDSPVPQNTQGDEITCGSKEAVQGYTIDQCYIYIHCFCSWDSDQGTCGGAVEYSAPEGPGCNNVDPNIYTCYDLFTEHQGDCETSEEYTIKTLKQLRDQDDNRIDDQNPINQGLIDFYKCRPTSKTYPCSSITKLSFFTILQLIITILGFVIIYSLIVKRKKHLRKKSASSSQKKTKPIKKKSKSKTKK